MKLYGNVSDKDKGIGGQKRYFVDANDVVKLDSGEEVVVCTQWGVGNIDNFIKHVENTVGYDIDKV